MNTMKSAVALRIWKVILFMGGLICMIFLNSIVAQAYIKSTYGGKYWLGMSYVPYQYGNGRGSYYQTWHTDTPPVWMYYDSSYTHKYQIGNAEYVGNVGYYPTSLTGSTSVSISGNTWTIHSTAAATEDGFWNTTFGSTTNLGGTKTVLGHEQILVFLFDGDSIYTEAVGNARPSEYPDGYIGINPATSNRNSKTLRDFKRKGSSRNEYYEDSKTGMIVRITKNGATDYTYRLENVPENLTAVQVLPTLTCQWRINHDNGSDGYHTGMVMPEIGTRAGNGDAQKVTRHTHNSNGTDYNQGNDNQHIKYTYCNGHGSDHSQNRSSGTWENHTWVETRSWYNYDNTTQHRDLKCSKCGRTKTESRTRYYYDPGQSGDSGIYVNISVISPTGQEDQKSGYIQLSRDGVNWSSETTDQILSYVRTFKYNDKLYVRYTRPYYDYYEFSYIDPKLPITKINNHTWCYTVQSESPRQYIDIHMQYKPFKVNYILSGGSLPNKKDTYIITDTFTIGEPSLSGYTFTGWTMTCSKGKANDRSFIPCNILVPTKDVTISNMYGDITLTANYEKSGTNDDNGHNKTPDDDGLPEHITDTGDRKTPLVTDSNTKHNMFRVTK